VKTSTTTQADIPSIPPLGNRQIILLILLLATSGSLYATVIPNCTNTGNVENNVENGVSISGSECGILDDDIGTLDGNITLSGTGNLTINGNITLLKGNIEVCSNCTLTINGTINEMEGSITNNGTILITGSITAAGKLEIKGGGETTLNGGSFESTGNEVLIESGATLNLLNGSSIIADSKINNNGTITSDGTGNSLTGPYEGGGDIPTELDCGSGTCTDNSGLPIELLSFSAQVSGYGVSVTWATLSETNNHFFTIERSSDGKQYETIAEINGAGNSQTVLKYSWVDQAPLPGRSFYRLRQTDFDGNFEVFGTSAVDNLTTLNWAAYPNPAKEYLTIVWPKETDAEVTVLTVSGQIVYQESRNRSDYGHSNLVVSNWQPGMYLINMVVGGVPHTEKLAVR